MMMKKRCGAKLKTKIKKQIKDLTKTDIDFFHQKYCDTNNCDRCPFNSNFILCGIVKEYWVDFKKYFSGDFLNQMVEIPFYLTNFEREILENLPTEFKYIVRDSKGTIIIFSQEPFKYDSTWLITTGRGCVLPLPKIFNFIKWEDDKPYLIEDLLKEK